VPGTSLILHHSGQEVREGGHLLLLHLEGQQRARLASLEQEEALADWTDGADGQTFGFEIVAFAHGFSWVLGRTAMPGAELAIVLMR